MIIYPAIDLIEGKCVRLTQGKYDDCTVYSDNPIKIAKTFKEQGAEFIHVVDLDGARSGKNTNREVILKIFKETGLNIQTGGGIRSLETIDEYLKNGIKRVILGTSAVKNPELLIEAVKKYGDAIAVGIDAKGGMVSVEGWEETSDLKAIDFAKKIEQIGVKHIIYTDIARDGMLKGPNLDAMSEMSKSVNIDVIASGGVSTAKDVEELKKTGVTGVIIGKALYTGDVDLKETIRISRKS